ncbi:ABC transporter substrate-binding protein [Diaminobutyricibacter sp. McL0618]|uniref:ABC transporter substrate-binding protein n=1 Tax=Leifsonia sp. McL0618 TaxID=3415677 RepID=UPI003CE9DE66
MRIQFSRAAKRLAPIAILAGAAIVLSGCSAPAAAPSKGIKGVDITFGGWGGEEGATKADFDGFQSSFTKSTGANVQWVGASYDQVQQQLALKATSDPVDVAQVDIGWITSFAAKNQLEDLNTVYGKETLASLYPKNLLELGQRNGKQVALPWTIASISLVANMDVLKAAGITEVPKTTDEFRTDLAAIKASQPGVIPYALNTKTAGLVSPFLQPWIWTFGGSLYNKGKVTAGDEGTSKAFDYIDGLVKDGLVQKGVDIFSARTLFAQGKVAFYDDAIIARGLVTDKARSAAVMPVARPVVISGDKPQSIQWGHALVMFKKDRTKAQLEAAKEFMSWLQDPKVVGSYFTSQGLLPATTAGLAKKPADDYSKQWIAITATSRPDETASYANGAQIATIVGQHGEAAYNGIESPKAAAAGMAAELKQLAQ